MRTGHTTEGSPDLCEDQASRYYFIYTTSIPFIPRTIALTCAMPGISKADMCKLEANAHTLRTIPTGMFQNQQNSGVRGGGGGPLGQGRLQNGKLGENVLEVSLLRDT
jgi:hypothetical protein